MAYSIQAIKYGWYALLGIALTGTTIYISTTTRRYVTQRDIIEIALAVTERCLATQITTNPTYKVAPPEFVRTWTSNVYTSNSVANYTNVVTNTIGNYIDRDMMVDLDVTIKKLVTNYYDVATMQPMTVTGLWASLGIGDGTNQFTRTPAIGGNPATYGDYPQQIYVTDLQERYKVLEAMKYVVDFNKDVVDESTGFLETYAGGTWSDELFRYSYSNKVTGVYPEYGWSPNIQAYLAELEEDYYKGIYPYSTNYDFYAEGTNTLHRHPTWDEAKSKASWSWYNYSQSTPPYRLYTNGYDTAYGHVYDFVGEEYQAYTSPHGSYADYKSYSILIYRVYGTVRWLNYAYTNIPSSIEVYYTGATNFWGSGSGYWYPTEITTNGGHYFPRSWDFAQSWSFGEDVTPGGSWKKMSDLFISQSNGYDQVVFGSDEFPPLNQTNSIPPFCEEPEFGTSWLDNTGSMGKAKGMRLEYDNITGVRKFQFLYCTNKYW